MRSARTTTLGALWPAAAVGLVASLQVTGCTATPFFDLPTDWDSLIQTLQAFAVDFARQVAAAWLF
jgi:hypothetical protein